MNVRLNNQIKDRFIKRLQNDKQTKNAFLLVSNESLDVNVDLNYGETSFPNQAYYLASIGKVFTSVIIGRLCEKKQLYYETKVMDVLGEVLLSGLHIFKGIDYTPTITIRQLLNHTSGIGDYFEDKPKYGESMLDMILRNPYRSYSSIEIVKWSREHISPVFKPDTGFHYSDTGYHLLGLVIEKLLGMPLYQVMDQELFKPLNMHHTYLASHLNNVENEELICDVYWENKNVKDYSIFKDDFAGGGIVTTSSDLLIFFKALICHEIVLESTLENMTQWSKHSSLKFFGIEYGLGLMSLKSTPLLFPKKYCSFGHMGSIGSFMFYNPYSQTYILGSLNCFNAQRKSMLIFFDALKLVVKAFEKR